MNTIVKPIMNQNSPTSLLHGYTLRELNQPDAGLLATSRSLAHQANQLGMQYQSCTVNDDKVYTQALTIEISGPNITPIICEISGWTDDPNRAASENIIQAASGIMSVHGRFCGKPKSLGIHYVSTVTACLALQGIMAGALAQLQGKKVNQITTSMSACALLCIGQYLAGATAPEEPEQLLPGQIPQTQCLPFISSDGIAFELETLSPKPWQVFWEQLGADKHDIAQGWTAFMLRYAKAISPLPTGLIDCISKQTFMEIDQIALVTNMSICRIRTAQENQVEGASPIQEQSPWQFTCHQTCQEYTASSKKNKGNLPLEGLTVIESCRRIQGPLAGQLLRLSGAKIIRIEQPGGDPLRGMPPMANGCSARFKALNNSKNIHEIDIKSAHGQHTVQSMALSADVFLHNWAPGKAAEFNLDHEHLTQENPALIYAYAGGWEYQKKPLSMPGTDFMAQAYSGVADIIGQASGSAGGSLFTVLDVLGGIISAQAITAALLHRETQSISTRVDTSLMGAANLLLVQEHDKSTCNEQELLNEIFQTKKGLIAIECHSLTDIKRLLAEIDSSITIYQVKWQQRLQKSFLKQAASQWVEQLNSIKIANTVVIEDLTEVLEDKRFNMNLNTQSYTQVNSPWRFSQ